MAKAKKASTAVAAQKVKKTKKSSVAAAKKARRADQAKQSRTLKQPARLPSAWQLTKATARLLVDHKGLFLGITAVYGILNLILVQSLATADLGGFKEELSQLFAGNFSALASSLGIFVVLVGSAGNSSSPTAGVYQALLTIIGSLAVIWALRQVKAGSELRIRDAYYQGMYPLIPFVLVLLVVALQLVPMFIGSSIYNLVITNGIAIYAVEKLLWMLLFAALSLLTFYMLTASLLALYIATLPDMTPVHALKSARQLVRQRRWTVMRKILFLPLVLLSAAAVVMLPIIIWVTPLAQWMFFALTMFSLVVVHAYMYNLYRELLNE